jgi:hypothetical protein
MNRFESKLSSTHEPIVSHLTHKVKRFGTFCGTFLSLQMRKVGKSIWLYAYVVKITFSIAFYGWSLIK